MGLAKVDLHLHFDGALTLEDAYELAKQRSLVKENETLEGFGRRMSIPTMTRNLAEYLKCFDLPLAILQDEAALKQSMFALIQRLEQQGLLYVEIRFAPQLHTEKGLSQKEVIEAVLQGRKMAMQAFNIKVNLILCMMMVGPAKTNQKENEETIRLAQEYLGQGVVALDLAGDEEIAPLQQFESLFVEAKQRGIPFVIHAGECGPASNVLWAIQMGAKRIGHGGRCIQDNEVLRQVIETQIPLELCPTSNLQSTSESSYEDHAMRKLWQAGAKVTLNTDNPTLSMITLESEIDTVMKTMGLTEQDIHTLTINALQASFLSDQEKREFMKQIKKDYQKVNF